MSHPLMSMAVVMARHDDMMREIDSGLGRMRSEVALQRRQRRAARWARVRQQVSLALRHPSATPAEVRDVMTIAKAR